MRSLLTITLVAVIASASAQQGGMMCSFCMTIVSNTQAAFGSGIANVNDLELLGYFREECPRYAVKSAMMAAECEYLVSEHPLILFRDLRAGKEPVDTCTDCQSC
ncbi:hypothetical protein OESDEN_23524 [Oesophagostomum dentatum]|uniref:Saposin B-type domain-containing protein n=1 Tax=Oesophagostomum dentatum TaxID=61180 RepID=A0A0B1RYX7_OESDE|nr:hypothetical protein OESDEN_23524 [Oesophagostomum dentatum]